MAKDQCFWSHFLGYFAASGALLLANWAVLQFFLGGQARISDVGQDGQEDQKVDDRTLP